MPIRAAKEIVQSAPRRCSETSRSKPARRAINWLRSSGATHQVMLRSGGAQIVRSAENQGVERDIDGTVSTLARSANTSRAATTASDRAA